MPTLYYAPGACSLASHIALEEAGTPYDTVRLDLAAGDQRAPEYLAINERGRVPALVVGGASHSEHAASRMLILNGQIYHEGDRLTAELTLQQIQLRSAVLSFRGYRFGINY